MTPNLTNTAEDQCNDILKVKNIISDFLNDKDHNAEILNIVDINDPLFVLPHYLKTTLEALDMLLIIKQSKSLTQN